MSKKLIALFMAAMMLLSVAAACGNKTPAETPTQPTTPAPTTPAETPTTPAPTEPVDPDADKYGGELNVGTANATNTMDLHKNSGTVGNLQWSLHVFEPLAVQDANGKSYGVLADYEASPDGLKHTYTLKKGIKFSNGEEVTMEDVEASIRRGWAAISTESSFNKYWKDAKVTFTDTQFIVEYEKFNINFIPGFHAAGSTAYHITTKEVCEKYPYVGGTTAENGITWGGECAVNINDLSDVIGTGPYVMTKWTDNAEIVLERNALYVPITEGNEDAIGVAAPRKAYLDKIVWSYNADPASRTAAMMAGEYDAVAVIESSMEDALLATGVEAYDPGTSWTHGIYFNLNEANADSPIADVNVRKAIMAALDMNAIMMVVANGNAELINLEPYAVAKTSAYASTKMEDSGLWNAADPDLAKQYLAQSSYSGEPIVYMCASSGWSYNETMAVVPQLEAIGLNIELKPVDSGSFSSMRSDPAAGFDISCWNSQKKEDNPVLQSTFVTGSQGWWSSDVKTAAIKTMQSTPTGSAESIAAYNDFLDAVIDEVPYILFGHPTGCQYRAENLETNQNGSIAYYFWNSYWED